MSKQDLETACLFALMGMQAMEEARRIKERTYAQFIQRLARTKG